MISRLFLSALLFVVFFALTACTAYSDDSIKDSSEIAPNPNETSIEQAAGSLFSTEVQEDNQGAVSVTLKPLNLNNPGETIDFEIAMNTHSVDLSMNLAETAILSTDRGLEISAITWDGMSGGHHVSGNLSFPSNFEGQSVLEGSTQLTLTIRNVDVPERVFVWVLQEGS